MKKKEAIVPAETEVPIGEIEWRLTAAYLRNPENHALYPVMAEDVQDRVSRDIVQAVHSCVQAQRAVTPVNIQEAGTIPQKEIEDRLTEFQRMGSVWMRDMETYVERISAEGLRLRIIKAYHAGINRVDFAPWREVEQAHGIAAQDIVSIKVGSANTEDDEIGVLFEQYADMPEDQTKPIAFPWAWMNNMCGGGMFPGNRYVFAGPYGQRKSTALYAVMHHAVFNQGKVWTHFAYDGGDRRSQMIKFFVIHWASLVRKWDLPFTCPANVKHEGQIIGRVTNYAYLNVQVAHLLLYGKDTGCSFPAGAMDAFRQAQEDMVNLRKGSGPGVLVMIDGKKVGMDVYRSAQILRNQRYGETGIDAFSIDHIGKPTNKYQDPKQATPETIRVLGNFVDTEGVPGIFVSHLTVAGIANAQNAQNEDVNAGLRYAQELQQDAQQLFLFGYRGDKTPDRVTVVAQKNRDGAGGPGMKYIFRMEPTSGLIWDDPKWAEQASKQMQRVAKQRAYLKNGDDDDDEE